MARNLLLFVALWLGCANESRPSPSESSPPTRSAPGAPIRVGNQVKGVEAQPDYDAEAEEIRQRVGDSLPQPLPSSKAACNTMLDTVIATYRRVDGEGARSVVLLEQTRDQDQRACEQETSPAAAACVAVLLTRDGGEYAWLLDQCSRAFPS